MKRILIVTPIYPPRTGGAATYFSTYVVARLKRQYCFRVLTIGHGNDVHSSFPVYQIPNVFSIGTFFPKTRFIITAIVTFFVSLFLINRDQINLVHSHSATGLCLGATLAAKCLRIPVIKDLSDSTSSKINLFFPRPAFLICLQGTCYDYAIASGVSRDIILPSPLPYDRPAFTRSTDPQVERQSYLYIGNSFANKGFELMINLFSQLDHRLTVIGNIDEDKRAALDKQPVSNVNLVGSLPNISVLEYIKKAICVIIPSKFEGIPRVLIEALETGTPAIVNSEANYAKYVKEINGVHFANFSQPELAELLDEINSYQGFTPNHHHLIINSNEYGQFLQRTYESCF